MEGARHRVCVQGSGALGPGEQMTAFRARSFGAHRQSWIEGGRHAWRQGAVIWGEQGSAGARSNADHEAERIDASLARLRGFGCDSGRNNNFWRC